SASVRDSDDEIVQACAEAWNWLANDPGRIRSIGDREWATVTV
ncbi:MAG TPA: IS630 family transposase, partial [Rhodopila sp.]